MATTNPKYGRLLTIELGGTAIENLISHGLSKSRETRDVTTKDSEDNQEVRPTIKSRELSFEGLVSDDATNGYDELDTALDEGTLITFVETDGIVGHTEEQGSGYITSLEKEAPHDGNVTFSGTLTVSGPTEKSVIPAPFTVSSMTVGATTAVTLSATPTGLRIGSKVSFLGVTGTVGVLLNGITHTITNIAGAVITISTSTTGSAYTSGGTCLRVTY